MAGKQTEFWLPPEFLTGDDVLMDPYYFENSAAKAVPRSNLLFPSEFSRDLCSSPVDSAENESDEEESLDCLTRRLWRTLIEEADKSARSLHHLEGFVLSRSPQSTLAQVGSWTGRSSGSSNGSPNGPSLVSSPPTTPLGAENDAWDLLFHDVGQVDRLKMTAGDRSTANNRSLPDLPPANLIKNPISGVHISPFHQARGSHMMQHQSSEMWGPKASHGWLGARQLYQTRVGSGFVENGGRGRTVLGGGSAHSAALHSLQFQQQNHHGGPATRAAFPGGSGGGGMKRECAGTGVFIPRRYGCNTTKPPADSRKTTGSSGALLSTKAGSGVNRSFEGFNGLAQPQMNPLDLLIARRNAALLAQRVRNLTPEVSISPELRLPPEWTY